MKSKSIHIIKIILFSVVFLAFFKLFTFVFVNKTADSGIRNIYLLEENLDVVFVGTSITHSGISPLDLYNDYGIKSCNIASSGQPVGASYYALKELFNYQKPKVVVMDVSYASLPHSQNWINNVLDYMKPGLTKTQAVLALTPSEKWTDYLLPLTYLHSNWDKLGKNSFHSSPCLNMGGSVTQVSKADGQIFDTSVFAEKFEIVDADDKLPFNEDNYEYYLKIISMCKKNNCKILFVSFPGYYYGEVNHGDGLTLQRYANSFYDIAEEYDVDFINSMHHLDDIGFDFVEDLRDWHHMNVMGNKKMTSYLGKYIVDNYNIPDRRSDENHKKWEKAYTAWDESRWKKYNDAVKE